MFRSLNVLFSRVKNHLQLFLIISIFTSCFFINKIQAQKTNKILLELINQKSATLDQKFENLCQISSNYADFDSINALKYANQAMKIAKESNSLRKEIIAFDYLLIIARRNNNVKKQIEIIDKCNVLAKSSKDSEVIAYLDFFNSTKYYLINDKEKYVYYALKSFQYFEKNKKRYDKLVSGYSILGTHFLNNENVNLLKKYYLKCYQLGKESNDITLELKSLSVWANYIRVEAENSKIPNKKLIDSSVNCLKKIIKTIKSKSNLMELCTRDYSKSHTNLAALYIYHFDNKIYKDTILEYLNLAEKINLKTKNNESLITIYGLNSEYLINNKKFDEAEKILKKVDAVADSEFQTKPISKARVADAYMKIAKQKNDFPMFLKYFEIYVQSRNAQHKKETNETIYNASIKFETAQKEKEIANLTAIAEARKKTNYALIALSILSLLTLFFIYRTNFYRQKSLAKANELLQKANEEANLISKLNEEEAVNTMLELEIANRERKMIEQEKLLTEQQKEKLQHELMTNNLQLESKKNILKEIKEKLASIKTTESKQISRTINKSQEVDEEFELLKSSFESANPVFFSTLQEKAASSLTKLDLKYCGYFKLGMGTKEVANIMNIEPKSMRMARYRIRQKLNLQKEDDLDDYINSI